MLRLFALLMLCACAGACAATGNSGTTGAGTQGSARPGRVTLVDYRTHNRLTLVNEAHTDPTNLYTEKRATASTKVSANEIFDAMIGHFRDEGFFDVARSGHAPIAGEDGLRTALEVETDGQVRFLTLHIRDTENFETLLKCKSAFVQIYNMTDQNQAISNDGGPALFEQQQADLLESNKDRKRRAGLGLQ